MQAIGTKQVSSLATHYQVKGGYEGYTLNKRILGHTRPQRGSSTVIVRQFEISAPGVRLVQKDKSTV